MAKIRSHQLDAQGLENTRRLARDLDEWHAAVFKDMPGAEGLEYFRRYLQWLANVTTEQLRGAPDADPMRMLTPIQAGRELGILDDMVRLRERSKFLFSVMPPGKLRGREFPAFQTWPGIAGEPMRAVLSAIGPAQDFALRKFFADRHQALGGLTPVDVMLGQTCVARELGEEAQRILAGPQKRRLERVISLAREVFPPVRGA